MHRIHILLVLILSLTFFSCQNSSEGPTKVIKIKTSFDTIRVLKNVDTIIKEILYERPLNEDITFGITLTEWNKDLAKKALEGNIHRLNNFYIEMEDYHVGNALKGFIFLNKSDVNSNLGHDICGLFIKHKRSNFNIEIFKRDSIIIDEPILMGIEKKINLQYDNYTIFINNLINEYHLIHIAGNQPDLPTSYQLTKDDFEDPVQNGLDKFGNASQDKQIEYKYVNKTLYENDRIYVVIETTTTKRADVYRNSDYEVSSIKNPFIDYSCKIQVFSKRYNYLKPIDYMNYEQKSRYNDSIKTAEIINQTLK